MASSGAQAFYNHYNLQKKFNDQYITMRGYQTLEIDSDNFKHTNITLTTYEGTVLLTGQVFTQEQKQDATKLIKRIPGVTEVYNWLEISERVTRLTQLQDSWLTTKIKAKLMATSEVDASQVKVLTENGTVFVMGILTPDEAEAVVDCISDTDGVKRIIKIFNYIHISRKATV